MAVILCVLKMFLSGVDRFTCVDTGIFSSTLQINGTLMFWLFTRVL